MQVNLIGSWRLVTMGRRNSRGEFQRFFGETPQGLVVYGSDGHMAAVMTTGDRSRFQSNDLTGGTPDEKSSAFDTCIAYAGPYTMEGDRVIHHAEVSLFPNWVGTDQQRTVRFEEGRLILSSQPILTDGEEWTYEVIWVRASGSVSA